mmetsp:Transcript_4934/g.19772  ORF Transcript_4934/g.19772 Transcript_4934/m.19772 type:complete len:378 (-) Transcript_4934:26-1159(-)
MNGRLVHLDVPLPLFLEPLEPLLVVDALLLAHALEHGEDAGHHALQPAEVHVRAAVQQLEHLVLVLLNLVLDVHLAALGVVLLARQRVVHAELAGEALDALLDLVVVELGVRVGDAHEEPREALELPRLDVLDEEAAVVRAHGRDAGAGGDHDHGSSGVLGEEHHLAGGAGHHHLLAGLSVAQKVGADALLLGILGVLLGVPVGGAAHAERGGLAVELVAVAGRGDGVQAHAVGHLLALGVHLGAGGDDAVGLALPEGHLATVLDDDVARLAGGVGADDALDGLDGAGEGALVLERVQGQRHVLELQGHGRAASLHGLLLGGLHLQTEAVVGAARLGHRRDASRGGRARRLQASGAALEGRLGQHGRVDSENLRRHC